MPGETHIWEVRNPDGGMLGMEVAKSVMAPSSCVLGHAFPERVDIEVRDGEGHLVARAQDLKAGAGSTPMARFSIRDGGIEREQIWPDAGDHGRHVILPGGEVGVLKTWWNADDGSEWRWEVEFYNHR